MRRLGDVLECQGTSGVELNEKIPEFSLLGGPLHRLGCRLGLVCDGTNTIALGLVIGIFLWAVLVLLALIEGIAHRVFSLSVIGAHVRLLVAIPLFFLCEAWLDPELAAFVRTIVDWGVAPQAALPALQSQVARVLRWKNSSPPEILCLLAAVLLPYLAPWLHLTGATAVRDTTLAAGEMTLTAEWYWIVCLTVFRFLILRWAWRLGLWWYFLGSLSRMNLHLVPTHPDGVGGLGYLEVVHSQFIPLVLAISAMQSAAYAEEMSAARITITGTYPGIALNFIVLAALFLAPLCIFAPRLWTCRVKGLADYMGLAARYVTDFDSKWLRGGVPTEPLLGTADLQSLADLSNSVNIVRNMSMVPVSQRMLVAFAVAAVLPMLPLALLAFPVNQLAENFFKAVLGL